VIRAAALVAVVLALLGGCQVWEPSGSGRPYEDVCGETPSYCLARNCVTSVPSPRFEDCCDSYYCNCDPETHRWTGLYCDLPAPPDAAPDAAPDATPDAS
jgi:hypothetical protein